MGKLSARVDGSTTSAPRPQRRGTHFHSIAALQSDALLLIDWQFAGTCTVIVASKAGSDLAGIDEVRQADLRQQSLTFRRAGEERQAYYEIVLAFKLQDQDC